jgi:hypothetical protein
MKLKKCKLVWQPAIFRRQIRPFIKDFYRLTEAGLNGQLKLAQSLILLHAEI